MPLHEHMYTETVCRLEEDDNTYHTFLHAQAETGTSAAATGAAQATDISQAEAQPNRHAIPSQAAAADVASGTDQAECSTAPAKAPAGRRKRTAEPVEAAAVSNKRATRNTRS